MAVKTYRYLELLANRAKAVGPQLHFEVQLIDPLGGKAQVVEQTIGPGLRDTLNKLAVRELTVEQIIVLGAALADLLLPDAARQLLNQQLGQLRPDEGLRLRLRLDPLLTNIPWEYMYVPRGDGEADCSGFLALDPKISLVRDTALALPGEPNSTPRPRRLLALLSSPYGVPGLDLEQERKTLFDALTKAPHISLEFVEPPTLGELEQRRFQNADIFHFGGHGEFSETGLGIEPVPKTGVLLFQDEQGRRAQVTATQLGNTLRAAGIQLAVLGACKTASLDGENRWNSTATALMRAEIPAVVGMQFRIWDQAALTFNERFYQALAAGLTLDEAVVLGRLAIFNVCDPLRNETPFKMAWRDWGIPVLYSRGTQPLVLPAITEPVEQRAAQLELNAVVKQMIGTVSGRVVGIDAEELRNAGVLVEQRFVSVVAGAKGTGLKAKLIKGGSAKVNQSTDELYGVMTGMELGTVQNEEGWSDG